MIFFYLSKGMENCKMSGKNQGTLKLMISGNPVYGVWTVSALFACVPEKGIQSKKD